MFNKMTYPMSFVLALGLVITNIVNAADPSLVAYWTLDEGTGIFAMDSTDNGNDGTLTGDPQWIVGRIGGALEFDGSGDYVDCGDNPSLSITDAITITLWINRINSPGNSYGLVSKGGGWTTHGYTFWQRAGVIRPELQGPNAKVSTDATILPEDMWHHVAFTWEDITDMVNIYIDGALASTGTFAGPIGTSTENLRLGDYSGTQTRYYDGKLDDVQIYNRALTGDEILKTMEGISMSPGLASEPNPANGAAGIPQDVSLSWTPGEYAKTHDVYLGEVFEDVNNADRGNPGGALVSQDQITNLYTPASRLDFGQTYYWRIDEVNGAPDYTIFKGNVWSFTIEPYSYPIENITATASSVNKGTEGPENTINGSGLNENGLHSLEGTDMWLSSGVDPNPTWIQYEFDKVHKLHQMLVWNYNNTVEPLVGFGIREATIEYSVDGTDWTILGTTHEFAQGPGAPDYASNTTIDLGGVVAKYVKVTANSNWGGMLRQYGLSEVRFLYIPVRATEPTPDSGATDVSVDAILSFKAGREAASHNVYLDTDEQAVIDGIAPVATVTEAGYAVSLDLASTYYWRVDEVNDAEIPTTWQGDIWNLSTQEYLVVDDFESYNDIPAGEEGSNLVYDTWLDGFGNPANGSTIGYNEPFQPTMETSILYDGKQSVPFFYDNTAAAYSEATAKVADLDVNGDWSEYGIKALTILFRGDPNNVAQQMYVKVNNTKVTYDGEAENLRRKVWQMWYIDLASIGVALGNITDLAIGFERMGMAGGEGMVLLDGVRLYSYDRQLITPTEPDAAGLQAHYEFEGNTSDSAGLNHGTATGDPTFVAGKLGQAILFDGVDDYVDCGTGAALDIQDAITMSCWIKVEAFTKNWEAILSKGDDSYRISRSSTTGNSIHFGCNGTTGGNINATAIVADNSWHHVACVYDGANKIIYIDGREDTRAASTGQINISTYPLWIGNNSGNTVRHLGGLVDDVRIYSRALSLAEVAWLSGRALPFDRPF